MWLALSVCSLAAWIALLGFRGGYWRAGPRLPRTIPPPSRWPAVSVVVPARNEAPFVERSLRSLLDQDYPGPLQVLLVDDQSEDGTGRIARELAATHPRGERLRVFESEPLPPGWLGKPWALATGVGAARERPAGSEFLLFSDADVVHEPGSLRALVAYAEAQRLELVSLMVLLEGRRGLARLLIPAFVYFFQKLYPFRWVNDPRRRTAAAAGGCILVRAGALERAGGVEAIRGELIDDCALGRAVKRVGPIWLGLTRSARSVRPYPGLRDVWEMVARTAYTELRYSPARLAVATLGMLGLYLGPPALAIGALLGGRGAAAALALGAWSLASASFVPTLRLYGRNVGLAPALPLAAFLYVGMTLDSARRHTRGRGGAWKGRLPLSQDLPVPRR